MKVILLIVISIILSSACSTTKDRIFPIEKVSQLTDYSNIDSWAASPFKVDNADECPSPNFVNNQENAEADVFFVHPTTYTTNKGEITWNADISDAKLNKKTDEGTILFQASVFNGAGRIFAPRYRQAHINVFYLKSPDQKDSAKKALDLAYEDVKASFEYYLENYNNGRPIIIASHSQGTLHAVRLINDFFEGKELMEQLVVAYLIGMPIREDTFETLKPCKDKDDIDCFNSWRSYQRGYLPKYHEANSNIIVTNPLSWTRDHKYVPKEENDGTLLFKFNKGLKPNIVDAQIYEDHLWINKPKFRGSAFVTFKNYHIADYNLFYADIRANAVDRVNTFLEKSKE